ncbi:menaquinone biosynthesis decarboxylase [Desulfomonile tiedjei]|uniref:3-octaprenyl-4hydroxybenzoate decarboxylase n=1 Tax=Desulfomonile tiedjei (strain ATCC 49306 / DSM 6799 / DCB-1) TaxID=706587 RepID=I4C0H2_DESTA|nr:menaquinone biosynthesis decarboxylase [Desulfomonile tiedjei]AFM23063.1 3-octaprenyl-4hydroxybenzoate decarboxylase [Desulfomonile tiedjei DSM 6799]
MVFQDLREFISYLEQTNQLVRISTAVDRDLEITEIADRIMKGPADRNKAILFENVEGFPIPVAINLFGSESRMAAGLNVNTLDDLNHKLTHLIDLKVPKGLRSVLARGADILTALKSVGLKPKMVRSAPCQEVVITKNPSLDILPVLKCWPKDAGRFITLMQVITRDPVTKIRNVGMYRLQVLGPDRLAMHWQEHKGGAEHERKAQEEGITQIPAAVVLGGDPASMWAASAPMPPDLDEYLLAGWLRGKPVEFVNCVSQPLEVPANAEIVIEGYVDLTEYADEGPFGDHTGYYTPKGSFPVFRVTAITHRENSIYPATVVGIPPMEDVYMGKATERLFLPLIKLFLPEVVDYHMPPAGVFHNLVLVKIKKKYPGHARKVMFAIWGMGLLMLSKAIVVLDDWVDVHNLYEVAWQTLGNVDWERDILVVHGAVDQLDHASSKQSYGAKIGIDATAKTNEDGYSASWPEVVQMSPEIKSLVDKKWKDLGL